MKDRKPLVCVLLSTYNGSAFLEEQIESIVNQTNVEIQILIRDDGSKDETLKIINKCISKYSSVITLIIGENIGFAESFMFLVENCPKADYYSFSDQDDIWEKEKLERAISRIDINTPMLYGSNLKAYDMVENRRFMVYGLQNKKRNEKIMKEYIFISNPHGCTMVWNQALQNELNKRRKPKGLTHDVWVNLVAGCKGRIYFDYDCSFINYRIHGNNTCGTTPKSVLNRIKKYYSFYFVDKKSLNISLACKTINKIFPESKTFITEALGNYNKSLKNFYKAIKIIWKMSVSRNAKIKYIMLMVFGKF